MKAELDFGNLSEMVNQTIEKNIQMVIEEQIRKQINSGLQDKLEEFINKKLEEYVDNYLKNTIIKVGGDYFKGIPEHEATIEDYMREYVGKRLEACDAFKVKKKRSNYYGDDYYEEISFEKYVEEKLKADNVVNVVVENKIKDFLDRVKREINRKMDEAFTLKTQQMLSTAVCNILSANSTYQQIQNNIKLVVEGGGSPGLPFGGQ